MHDSGKKQLTYEKECDIFNKDCRRQQVRKRK